MMRFKHDYSEMAICWDCLFLMATLDGPPLPLFPWASAKCYLKWFAGTDKVCMRK